MRFLLDTQENVENYPGALENHVPLFAVGDKILFEDKETWIARQVEVEVAIQEANAPIMLIEPIVVQEPGE